MTTPTSHHGEDVAALNDRFAREHDINEYYARASLPIRLIEGRRLAIIRRMVGPHENLRILEIGCGGGHVLRCFPGARLVGVDVSSVMLDKARRNLAGLDAELHLGEITEVELPQQSFDRVICTEVLEHVVEPEPILESARRLLRPDGRAVITFPNDRLIERLKRVVVRSGLSRLPALRRVSWGGEQYHLHVWTLAEMRGLVSQSFTIDEQAFAPVRALPVRCCFAARPR